MSKYIRKTHDEYDIEGLYDGVWSVETTELTLREARQTMKTYSENCPHTFFRIKHHRVPNS